MTDKELDDLFKQSFAGHEMPVPDDMWQRVQPQKDKKRRGIILWWSGLGVAAALILMSTATWFYFHQETSATVAAASSLQKEKETTLQKPADKTSGQQKPTSGSALPVNNTNSTALSIPKPSEQKEDNNPVSFTEKKKEIETGNFVSALNNVLPEKENSQAKEAARQHENVFQHNDILPNKTTDKTNDSAAVMLAEKTTETSPDPGKDSTSLSETAEKKEAAKAIEATAIQIKKHRNKAASIELMIAGYTGDNNIYGTEKNVQPQFARLGFIDPQEKTTLRSGSVNVRIEKPVTENLSVKTGLQFLQTHQRVTYTLESVDQFAVVTSLGVNNDTTRYAQIHSEHRVVKSVYNSLNVPLLLSYHTSGSNLSVGASGGVLLNLVSWYKGKVPDGDYKRTVAAKNTFRWNSGASLYLSLSAAKTFGNWQLFAEPHIQYTLSSLTKNSASFRQKTTYYGLGIGIRKRIGK